MKRLFVIITMCLALAKPLRSQSVATTTVGSQRYSASIDLGNTQVATIANSHGTFSLVGIQPSQTIGITIQYDAAAANRTIACSALDGGQMLISNGVVRVGTDGTFSFQFRAGQSPGLYRVILRDGEQQMSLRLWVLDAANPQNNPGCITAANPNN